MADRSCLGVGLPDRLHIVGFTICASGQGWVFSLCMARSVL